MYEKYIQLEIIIDFGKFFVHVTFDGISWNIIERNPERSSIKVHIYTYKIAIAFDENDLMKFWTKAFTQKHIQHTVTVYT